MADSNVKLLKWMLEDVRKVTLSGVNGLSKEKLFQPPIAGEYPIGAYLMHFAEVDAYWYWRLTGMQMPEELRKRSYDNCWFDCPKENYNPPAEPIEVEEYLYCMNETRKILLEYMDSMNDDELEQTAGTFRNGEPLSKKWILYHLLEHEAHHRGQVFMLIRMGKLKAN